MRIETRPFDLDIVTRSVVDLLKLQAADKGIELVLRRSQRNPRVLVGDEGRLRQVLLNLTGNAVKFTSKGKVILGVDCPGIRGRQGSYSIWRWKIPASASRRKSRISSSGKVHASRRLRYAQVRRHRIGSRHQQGISGAYGRKISGSQHSWSRFYVLVRAVAPDRPACRCRNNHRVRDFDCVVAEIRPVDRSIH